MTAYDAYLTAQALAEHGFPESDAITRADYDAAADQAGAARPADGHDRYVVRVALDAIGGTR